MRQITALALVITLIFSSCGSALADTLKLPARLISVEREAFYGDTSLDEVVVPYGTEYIKSKAFANSSIQKVYIPDTVTFIANNAFENAEDVTIYAPDGSYAQEYAEEHDLLWEGSDNAFRSEQLQTALEIYHEMDSLEQLDTLLYDTAVFDYSDVSTEGVTDTELLEYIAKYNALNGPLQEAMAEFEQTIYDLADTANSGNEHLSSAEFGFSDSDTSVRFEEYSFSMSESGLENLSESAQVTSVLASEDGATLLIELQDGGKTYYLQSDLDGMTVTSNPVMSRKDLLPIERTAGISALAERLSNVLSFIENQLEWARTYSNAVGLRIKNALEAAERATERASRQVELSNQMLNKFPKDSPEFKGYYDLYEHASEKYNNAQSKARQLKSIKEFYDAINIPDTVIGLLNDSMHFIAINNIKNHNHPTDSEASDPQLIQLIQEMVKNIGLGLGCYGARILRGGYRLFGQIASLLSMLSKGMPTLVLPSLTVNAVIKLIGELIVDCVVETIFDVISQGTYESILSTDKLLHSIVHGTVIDADTNEPLKNVAVTVGGRKVTTNAEGLYAISAPSGSQTLSFSKKAYNDVQKTLTVNDRQDNLLNVSMSSRVTLTGKVVDATSGSPLSGVTVIYGNYKTTTNSSGKYSFLLKPGTEKITFSKTDYISWSDTITLELNRTNQMDAALSKKLKPNEYRVVLSWGQYPADLDAHILGYGQYEVYYSNKSARNASGTVIATLDHDDTTSYGPETVTFLAETTGKYTYYVHDFTNQSNRNSTALGSSGATVRVYCGESMLGTYHVPKGTGTAWYVFTVENGAFKPSSHLGN